MSGVTRVTDNQAALLRLLASDPMNYIVNCSSGPALWRADVKWSQGRTPGNAIAQTDADALLAAGLLRAARYGMELHPTFSAQLWARQNPDGQPWVRADDPGVYRGRPFCG